MSTGHRSNLAPIDASTIDSSRINIMDIRVSKRIRFGGDRRLELIAQAFNLFNTENLQAQFGAGRVTNATSAIFGQITSARPQRQVELALRLHW